MKDLFDLASHDGDAAFSCDVVVVGSGAGGAVVATELAESGLSVAILEEGPYIDAARHGAMRPSESLRHVWRDGGFTLAVGIGNTPTINVTMGRCVGGSSMITGGVCFRTPGAVAASWTADLGLLDYDERAMRPYFERVEEAIHVEEVPVAMRSRSTALFDEGARKLGYPLEPLRRNTKDCNGLGRCNFGCPGRSKLSVDLSYLPRALALGATLHTGALVERVVTDDHRATGIRGRILNGPNRTKGSALTVHARHGVVLACGAWHTPSVLRRSGLGNRHHLGKRMTLHPGFRVTARFDEPVRGWEGALQSAYTAAFEHEGLTLISIFVPPGVLGAAMSGVGIEHTDRAQEFENLAVFGGIVHDEGAGTIYPGPFGQPLVTYRMTRRDRQRVSLLIRTLAETYFAAGAREVYLPVMGMRPVTADVLRALDLDSIPSRMLECGSQHPLGSARMGREAKDSVVDSNGRVWDVPGLYIADGSIIPTSLGVNPQLTIMAVATRVAHRLRDDVARSVRRAS